MEALLGALLAIAGLTLPGHAWARMLKSPVPWLTGILISWLLIYLGVLGMTLQGIPITRWTLLCWLCATALAPLPAALRTGWDPRALPKVPQLTREHLWLLAALPAMVFVLVQSILNPLSGPENAFRHDHLARLIALGEGLEHYPAVTPSDFMVHFWPGGGPPLLSSLYAWCYMATGTLAPGWAAMVVVLEAAVLGRSLWLLAERMGGMGAGKAGLIAACACVLVLSTLATAQDSLLAAIGCTSMAYLLLEWDREPRRGLLLLAATGAALAAGTGELTLLYPAVAGLWVWRRGGLPNAMLLTLASLFPLVLWCLRSLLATGNPFYPHYAGSLFPVNPVLDEWTRTLNALHHHATQSPEGIPEVLRLCLLGMAPAIAGVAWIPLVRARGAALLIALLCLVCITNWALSTPAVLLPPWYFLHLLSPCACLGAAVCGAVIGAIRARSLVVGMGLLGLMAACTQDAWLRAMSLAANPQSSGPAHWGWSRRPAHEHDTTRTEAFLRGAIARTRGRTLALSMQAFPTYRDRCAWSLEPLWTPEVSYLFDHQEQDGRSARRLWSQGFRHVLIRKEPNELRFLAEHRVLEKIRPGLKPSDESPDFLLYDIPAPAELTAPGQKPRIWR